MSLAAQQLEIELSEVKQTSEDLKEENKKQKKVITSLNDKMTEQKDQVAFWEDEKRQFQENMSLAVNQIEKTKIELV